MQTGNLDAVVGNLEAVVGNLEAVVGSIGARFVSKKSQSACADTVVTKHTVKSQYFDENMCNRNHSLSNQQ